MKAFVAALSILVCCGTAFGQSLEARQRRELAESILRVREASSGRKFDTRFRMRLKTRLASRPLGQLQSLQKAGANGVLQPNALGDSSADLVYTPIEPCRIFDTRSSVAGILAANTERDFFVSGDLGFTDQGGTHPDGCGIPFGPATAVIMNFAAVTPSGNGNLVAWAVADPQPPAPTSTVLNYSTTLFALSNGIAVPICDPAQTACAFDLRLRANVSSVHVVGDVVGYFQAFASPTGTSLPIAFGYVDQFGELLSGSFNVTSTYNAGSQRYEITIDGEPYHFSNYVTVITPTAENLLFSTGSISNMLIVNFRTPAGALTTGGFGFVTFKP